MQQPTVGDNRCTGWGIDVNRRRQLSDRCLRPQRLGQHPVATGNYEGAAITLIHVRNGREQIDGERTF